MYKSSRVAPRSTVDKGDLDSYTFPASAGARITLTMTELVGTALTPALVPTGTLVATNYAADVASVSFTAATSGIHTVVAYDWWNGLAGVGNYSLRME